MKWFLAVALCVGSLLTSTPAASAPSPQGSTRKWITDRVARGLEGRPLPAYMLESSEADMKKRLAERIRLRQEEAARWRKEQEKWKEKLESLFKDYGKRARR